MATQEAIQERKKTVMDLILRGYRPDDILGQIAVDRRTLTRDLQEIRKEMQAESGVKQQYEELFAQLNEESKLRVRKIWAKITDARCTEKGFFRGLRELRAEGEFMWKRAQDIGVVPKDPSPLVHVEQVGEKQEVHNVQILIVDPYKAKKLKKVEKK